MYILGFFFVYVTFVCPEEDTDSVENLTLNFSSIVGPCTKISLIWKCSGILKDKMISPQQYLLDF